MQDTMTGNATPRTEADLEAEVSRLRIEMQTMFEQMQRDREAGQKALAAIRASGARAEQAHQETQDILAQLKARR